MAEEVQADVRILLVGDAGVGKTSLVMSLLEDEWVENVPAKLDRCDSINVICLSSACRCHAITIALVRWQPVVMDHEQPF